VVACVRAIFLRARASYKPAVPKTLFRKTYENMKTNSSHICFVWNETFTLHTDFVRLWIIWYEHNDDLTRFESKSKRDGFRGRKRSGTTGYKQLTGITRSRIRVLRVHCSGVSTCSYMLTYRSDGLGETTISFFFKYTYDVSTEVLMLFR